MTKKPLVLCILDGLGHGAESQSNAYYLAKTPTLDKLKQTYPNILIHASGEEVGLPEGQMGNSEVGHLNIGAGRIVYQSLTLINKEIKDKSFEQREEFNRAINHALENNSKLHIMGLLSDGGVHSHIQHIKALVELATVKGVKDVLVHAFLDGRDVEPSSAADFLKDLQTKLDELNNGHIATVSGRFYAMDRDKRFDRVQLAYECMVEAKGLTFSDPVEYVKASYEKDVLDEFVLPAYNEKINSKIEDNDAIIFANFRPDRATEIGSLITNKDYEYKPSVQRDNLYFVCMMKYGGTVLGHIAYQPQVLNNTLGEYLASQGKTQLRIAETEKYAHVTFFFDGGVNFDGKERPELTNCHRVLVNSPKVATYDMQPEMSAYEVKNNLLAELDKDIHDVVILNFANPDMVGHTGNIPASIKAVEVVDECVNEIYEKVSALGGTMLITADHGNVEVMLDENNNVVTSHSTNLVEFIITDSSVSLNDTGKLADIAPTMLHLLKLDVPAEMDGNVLVK